jgi:hypothetical protein
MWTYLSSYWTAKSPVEVQEKTLKGTISIDFRTSRRVLQRDQADQEKAKPIKI